MHYLWLVEPVKCNKRSDSPSESSLSLSRSRRTRSLLFAEIRIRKSLLSRGEQGRGEQHSRNHRHCYGIRILARTKRAWRRTTANGFYWEPVKHGPSTGDEQHREQHPPADSQASSLPEAKTQGKASRTGPILGERVCVKVVK